MRERRRRPLDPATGVERGGTASIIEIWFVSLPPCLPTLSFPGTAAADRIQWGHSGGRRWQAVVTGRWREMGVTAVRWWHLVAGRSGAASGEAGGSRFFFNWHHRQFWILR